MLTPKVAIVNGKKIEVSASVKNAHQRSSYEDRERKRRKRLAQKGIEMPEISSLESMYAETGFEVPAEDDVEETVARLLLNEQVRKAVAELPANKRDVIVHRYFKNMTIRDTAVALGLPKSTAESREKSALASLEKILQKFL